MTEKEFKYASAYMDVAERFSQLSTARKLKVGCVIVKDDRIISIGYNGTPSGWDNSCEDVVYSEGEHEVEISYKTKPEVLHAEMNALMKLARSSESGEGAEMYVTHLPCIECAKGVYQAGIKKVYYRNDYKAEKGCGDLFLLQSSIPVVKLSEEISYP